jgi:hypothetical protein
MALTVEFVSVGGAAKKLDYLEVVHVLIRRPNSSS